jgi:acyl-coenzyme A synthetase/AMP-(fatty) acid ligase
MAPCSSTSRSTACTATLVRRTGLFFQTSTTWMMWNWQLSVLATGAAIVLYDAPLTGPETVWDIVAGRRVTQFGTGPAYLALCQEFGYAPGTALAPLRSLMSIGSILHDRQFEWVAWAVKQVPVQSISGGADIILRARQPGVAGLARHGAMPLPGARHAGARRRGRAGARHDSRPSLLVGATG